MKRERAMMLHFAGTLFWSACAIEEPSDEHEQNEIEVGQTEQALYGTTTSCRDRDVFRAVFSNIEGTNSNMQAYSRTLPPPAQEWWLRTDCQALIVDWDRSNFSDSFQFDEAFVAGIWDDVAFPVGADLCSIITVSTNIMARYVNNSSFRDVAHRDLIPTPGVGNVCAFDFNSIAWLSGVVVPDYDKWFHKQATVRTVTQAFAWTFPIHASAYMQTQRNSSQVPCPTQCCYGGTQTACF